MKEYLKSRFKKGSVSRNVLILTAGTSLAQIIAIFISPILTRLYSPTDFGTFTLFTSLTAVLSVLATGRYELAIMLPKKEEDAFNLVVLCAIITLALSVFIYLPIIIFNQIISRLLRNPEISIWLYFVPVTILLTGLYQTYNFWSNRKEQYRQMALSRVLQAGVMAVISLLMGLLSYGTGGLIIGAIVGQGVATGALLWQNWKADKPKRDYISKASMTSQARVYKDFPGINSIHAFLDLLQINGIVFLISAFFGATILGYYTLTMRVLRVPLNFVGRSIGQVFYQKASEIYNSGGDLNILVKKTTVRLALMALPIFIILIVFAPTIFSFVFGEKWQEAGLYVQILSPWLYFNFIISPISQLPLLLNKQKTFLLIGFIYDFLIVVIVAWGGYVIHDIFWCFYVLSFALTAVSIYILFWLFKISKIKNNR